MQFSYQSEKLSAARACLMLPHTHGEAESIAAAFRNCSLAFHNMDESGLDDSAREWVRKIKQFMDTSGVQDPSGKGTWAVKASTFTTDQQLELSRLIDELAHWFDRRIWETQGG